MIFVFHFSYRRNKNTDFVVDRSVNFVEPQLLALVSLAVDCILSYHHHIRPVVKEEICDDAEPAAKRRKVNASDSSCKEVS